MKKQILAFCIMGLCVPAMAKETQVNNIDLLIGGWSHHGKERKDGKKWNENHNLLGACYYDFCAAYFKNSYGVNSGMFFYKPEWQATENISYGFRVGFMGGYKDHIEKSGGTNGFVPVVSSSVTYRVYSGLHADFSLAPVSKIGYLAMFNFRYDFGYE